MKSRHIQIGFSCWVARQISYVIEKYNNYNLDRHELFIYLLHKKAWVKMTGREIIKRLLEDGWIEVMPRTPGSHRHYRHPVKKGKVTVPEHGAKDIPVGTLKRIEKQCGLKF